MSLLLFSTGTASTAPVARRGVCGRQDQMVRDDTGVFHPLGVTFFWALYGWKYERPRIHEHLAWLATHRFDYLRILGEVDWTDRSIEPWWPDYNQVLQEFVDAAYDTYGLRVEMTIIGGRQYDKHTGAPRFVPSQLAQQITDALKGREHKVLHYEMANEWDRLDKTTMDELINMGQVAVANCPNLVALSRPADSTTMALVAVESATGMEPTAVEVDAAVQAIMNVAHRRQRPYPAIAGVLRAALTPGGDIKDLLGRKPRPGASLVSILTAIAERHGPNVDTRESADTGGYEAMINATKAAGGNTCTPHLRRSDHDHKWSHVRQGYDLKNFDPFVASNNEPQGPQSSVDTLENPLQLACARLMGILCGGAPYVLHVGQGVTGEADPNHGRPENMWEVPNIDTIMRVVRGVDVLVPEGIENWKVVNNGRSDHPLPLPGDAFWEGSHAVEGPNKNYAALGPGEFRELLIGLRSNSESGPVASGKAIRRMHVDVYNPETTELVTAVDLEAGQDLVLTGRRDTMAAYWLDGRYL